MKKENSKEQKQIYRIWYEPYGMPDEEDFIDVDADSEEEAVRFARTCGYVTGIEWI